MLEASPRYVCFVTGFVKERKPEIPQNTKLVLWYPDHLYTDLPFECYEKGIDEEPYEYHRNGGAFVLKITGDVNWSELHMYHINEKGVIFYEWLTEETVLLHVGGGMKK